MIGTRVTWERDGYTFDGEVVQRLSDYVCRRGRTHVVWVVETPLGQQRTMSDDEVQAARVRWNGTESV